MLSLTALVRRAALTNRDGVATEFEGRQRSWSQQADDIARIAAGLQACEIRADDRVALLAFNSDRFYTGFFAIPWAGAVIVPVNFRLTTEEMAVLLNDAEPVALLVDNHFSERIDELRRLVPSLRTIVQISSDKDSRNKKTADHHFDEWLKLAPIADAGRGDDDLAALYYTGGTTGRSKGVMLSHRNLVLNSLQNLAMLDYGRGEGVLHVAPLFHIGCTANSIIFTNIAGRHYFLPAFDADAVLTLLAEKRIERVFLVPTMINMVLNHPQVANFDLSHLRSINYGASPMPEAVIERARALWPHVKFTQAYGQTEAAPCVTLLLNEQHDGHLRSAGQPMFGVELAIHNADDKPLPPFQSGEICARGGNVMQGYWRNEKATAETLRNGWLHTGDVGYFDEDGYLYVVDRVKDMIVSGGENVYSTEVEDALYRHAAVLECAVIGVPCTQWGERVHAIVRLRENHSVTESELQEHCKNLIAGYKCPRSIEWRSEPLPLTAAGKVLKRDLRAPFWAEQTKQVC
ncbi:MAG: long-chain-fatty-acid--CoA ligase [Spongiibacteraceae bacterium]